MTPLRLTLGLGIAAAVAAGFLIPSTSERLAMLARDGQFSAALREGDRAIRSGKHDPRTLARLFHINSLEGDPETARRAIFAYLDQKPNDSSMLWRAAEFLEEQGDVEGHMAVLARLIDRTGAPNAIDQLASLYRLHGRFAEEQDLLLATDPGKLSVPMRWRTAGLRVRIGDLPGAAALVRMLDDEPGATGAEQRPLAFEILMRAGAPAEAGRRAEGWLKTGMLADEQALYVLNLATAGAGDAALALALRDGRQVTDRASLAWSLGTRGHFDLAEDLIDRWMAGGNQRLLGRATTLYVDLALSTGSVGRVLARTSGKLRSDDPALRTQGARLAATLFDRAGYASIASLRPLLTGEVLAREPLFGAALSQAERNVMAARYFLRSASLGELDEAGARLWTAMAEELLGAGETLDILRTAWRADALSPAMLAEMQGVARRNHRFDPAWAVVARPSHARPGA
ncbi:tetratricopeptide repeat protein [Aureimonas ureilytica]|uniref:tetratricopeptide repeat protein n=1 Tax=Aureimonas ureilytica TaxID=401562 RepID=UPI000375E209|nr:hypothetical protein [Aureimonas ureilytica]